LPEGNITQPNGEPPSTIDYSGAQSVESGLFRDAFHRFNQNTISIEDKPDFKPVLDRWK
jgi:hypothetical protein